MKRVETAVGVLCALSLMGCSSDDAAPSFGGAGGSGTTSSGTTSTGSGPQASSVASSSVSSSASSSTANSSSASGAGMAEGCSTGDLEAGTHVVSLQHDGAMREYRLHLPAGYQKGSPVSLVMNFHGYTMNMNLEATFTGMDAAADDKGYAVVYPNGIQKSWNGGACCGAAAQQNIDDVGFARAMVADISTRACIDTKRVYSTGFSNGGFLSHRLACEASDLVAAVAPVAGLLGISPAACQPQRAVPIIHFYGEQDSLVDFNYAPGLNALWASRNGCTGQPKTTTQVGAATCETYDQCKDGASVTMCSITNMGHCWPGRPNCVYGAANVDISANDLMWELFEKHALP